MGLGFTKGNLIRGKGGVNGDRERGESQSQRLALSREQILGCAGPSIIPISWASCPLKLPLLRNASSDSCCPLS